MREVIDKQVEQLLLLKSRIKYALREPNAFIPSAIIEKIPALPTAYQVITSFNLLPDSTDINSGNITTAIHALKNLLLNSTALSQQSNSILVTQVQSYY